MEEDLEEDHILEVRHKGHVSSTRFVDICHSLVTVRLRVSDVLSSGHGHFGGHCRSRYVVSKKYVCEECLGAMRYKLRATYGCFILPTRA